MNINRRFWFLLWLAAAAGFPTAPSASAAIQKEEPAKPGRWAAWVEPDFPFFSSILDARHAAGFPTNNLTPRGLVLNLGRECWVCFDTDLLRVAAIWRGAGVTPKALAPGSYHDPARKTPGGQFPAPEPEGQVWLASGVHPGWQTGARPVPEDPRAPAPSVNEVGRGPLPEAMGRFEAVRLVRGGVVLEYSAGSAKVREWWRVSEQGGRAVIERHLSVGPCANGLWLILGMGSKGGVALGVANGEHGPQLVRDTVGSSVHVPARPDVLRFCVTFTESGAAPSVEPALIPGEGSPPRWPQEVESQVTLSSSKEAYVVDHIGLPLVNPWRRNIRPGDIQFLQDGTGVMVTLDGDVWQVRGLEARGGTVHWRRFASGLHEPLTLAIRDEEVFVFDRNGIWRLRDTNGDGEADVHELFSNAFAQTADMREFPSTVRRAPGGEFVIAKGGQQATTLGKHNGSVLRISADGRRAEVLGYGFRQPNVGVNLRTGLVTSSDQEGQYIPATPLHIVRDRQFYGFLSEGLQPREQYPAPIAEPLTWVPHAVNASAMSQVWLFDARMGPLTDGLVHIGFNRPELFRVLMRQRGAEPEAAVVSVTRAFEFPPLNGSVNPADGQLYLAGFQVIGWGNSLDTLAGLGRVRFTGAPVTLPREVVPMAQGVLLRFDVELDAQRARNPDNYSLASWHYVRSHRYGSAQYQASGTPGQDWLVPSSACLSEDARSVFVGVPGMKPAMQLRIGWSLATAAGVSFQENAYTTPRYLAKFDPVSEGFGALEVDLTPRVAPARADEPVSVEEGRRLYQLLGCVACHSTEGADVAKIGPTWRGLFGSERPLARGKKVKADEAYLRESILDPPAKIVSGYEQGEYAMPSYAGVATDAQVESLILWIKECRAQKGPAAAAAPAAPAGTQYE